jgi:hypothetical protein
MMPRTNPESRHFIDVRCMAAPDPNSARTFLSILAGSHCVDSLSHDVVKYVALVEIVTKESVPDQEMVT